MIILKQMKESIDALKGEIRSLRYEIKELRDEVKAFENKEHIVSISVNNKPVGSTGPYGLPE